ncbi:MAG: sigma-70 family RNA polymerase sigma factor [Pseudomonadota bacterium]
MADLSKSNLDALMLRAADGDSVAFRQFYDLTAPDILAFLLKMLPDRHAAEDVLQESMVVAWNRAGEFDPKLAAAKTWITTIARRRALDVIRRRARRNEVLRDDANSIREVFGNEGSADNDTESNATAARLAHCFDEIGADSATCIQFAYLHGLTFSEIAVQVDRSLGTIKSWVRRGLQKLKACMER